MTNFSPHTKAGLHPATPAQIATLRGEHRRALALWTDLLKQHPNTAFALREKALLLSTSPDDQVRDGREALICLDQSVSRTGGVVWDLWLIRACVEAERGDFESGDKTLMLYLAAAGRCTFRDWHVYEAVKARQPVRLLYDDTAFASRRFLDG